MVYLPLMTEIKKNKTIIIIIVFLLKSQRQQKGN